MNTTWANPLPAANSRRPLRHRWLVGVRCSLISSWLGSPAAVAEGGRSSMVRRSFRVTNPEGWQKVAGGRSAAKTPGRSWIVSPTLEGWERSATPAGSGPNSQRRSGGIAPLNPRLPSGKPPACSRSGRKTNKTLEPPAASPSVYGGAGQFLAPGLRRGSSSGGCGSACR